MRKHTINRIAVVNRGEPAVRFIRALREYNLERGTQIRSLALFTHPDEGAPFVRMADEAARLGPAMIEGPDGRLISAYVSHDLLIKSLIAHQVDAVWPGWGFVSEDPLFVRRLEEEGIIFLGPSSDAMRALGDKIESKRLAEKYQVPIAPWCLISEQSTEELLIEADRIGYPLMVKASAGGGGRGIRKVRGRGEVLSAIQTVQEEVRKVFGQGGLFMEACITDARHIEVQLLVGCEGEAVALGIRDCSIQRRNQKVIEEGPSPITSKRAEQAMCEAAIRLAEGVDYRGAATAEYLYKPLTDEIFFLEVNSRLQVEHTVTEMTTGADLVKSQIDIARGLAWERPLQGTFGHAIEVRLNAENTSKGFIPAPGLVKVFLPPSGPGLRVDSGVVEGISIAPEFDSMIAKLIAWGRTRTEAIARLTRALREFPVVVEDGATNKAFLLDLLASQPFKEGTADTTWLDRAMENGEVGNPRHVLEAALAAGIIVYRGERTAQVNQFAAEAQNGIPQNLSTPSGMEVSLRVQGKPVEMTVRETGRDRYRVKSGGVTIEATFRGLTPNSATFYVGSKRHELLYSHGAMSIYVEIDGAGHEIEELAGGTVKSPAPAMVVSVSVREGDRVEVGDQLATLEAMKMEMSVVAAEAGVVSSVLVRANMQVKTGQALVLVEPQSEKSSEEVSQSHLFGNQSPKTSFDLLFDQEGQADIHRLDNLSDDEAYRVIDELTRILKNVILGYDPCPQTLKKIQLLFKEDRHFPSLKRPERLLPVTEVLNAFVTVESLFDRNLLPLEDQPVAVSAQIAFYDFCRNHRRGEAAVPAQIKEALRAALSYYKVTALDPTDELREALWRLAVAHAHPDARHQICSSILRCMITLNQAIDFEEVNGLAKTVKQVALLARDEHRAVSDSARQASYELFKRHRFVHREPTLSVMIEDSFKQILSHERAEVQETVLTLLTTRQSLNRHLSRRVMSSGAEAELAIEVLVKRLYQVIDATPVESASCSGFPTLKMSVNSHQGSREDLFAMGLSSDHLKEAVSALEVCLQGIKEKINVELILSDHWEDGVLTELLVTMLSRPTISSFPLRRITLTWSDSAGFTRHRTFQREGALLQELQWLRDIHPEAARRIDLWRLSEFELERLPSHEQLFVFRGQARESPQDERIFVFAEVCDIPERDEIQAIDEYLLEFEQAYFEGIRVIQEEQAKRDKRRRFHWNRLAFYLRPIFHGNENDMVRIARKLEAPTRGLGLQKVVVRAKVKDRLSDEIRDTEIIIANPSRNRLEVKFRAPNQRPIRALDKSKLAVIRSRRMGHVYPYEIIRMLCGDVVDGLVPHEDMRSGRWEEFDLDPIDPSRLISVGGRASGENSSGIVVGLIRNQTQKHPEGMERVWIGSDPTRAMGALAEAECRRVIAAIDLAEERGIPIEWLPISSGAKIAMDSGTENLDWTASVLKRIIAFTQAGGEINLIVAGVNVGAQSYWNAEATMLQHTRGILIMTPSGSMVLTGKKALEYSGSVAAEDERGIGGFDRIMGVNGQAQYFAQDLGDAYRILMEHYRFTYRAQGEARVRLNQTADPSDRDVMQSPYTAIGEGFKTIGEIFDVATNRDRKKPFAIREVMGAVIDQDGGYLERWQTMRHAETAVVWDAHLGGHAVTMIGFESRPQVRGGRIPMDGPDIWTGGTLFPQSSKKVARALNAASGNRPAVILANLSGFDGSPESLRKLQLEHGAEIGRAVVNFEGPILFVVIGRYHGGAYVVFSKALNPNLTTIALEGTFASVIGGAPAAAVVFPREVSARVKRDPRINHAKEHLKSATPSERPQLRDKLDILTRDVYLEKQGEVASEFDQIHTVHRATEVGSLDEVIRPEKLRQRVIEMIASATSQN